MRIRKYLNRTQSDKAYFDFEVERGKAYKKLLGSDFKDKNILDVGCAWGGIISAFREGRGIGIDTDADRINVGQKLTDKTLLVMDASDMFFDSCTFDTVMLIDLLEHVKYPVQIVAEVHRVLKDGGTLLVNFSPYNSALGGHLTIPYLQYLPKAVAYRIMERILDKDKLDRARLEHESLNRMTSMDVKHLLQKYFVVERSLVNTILGISLPRFPVFLCTSNIFICHLSKGLNTLIKETCSLYRSSRGSRCAQSSDIAPMFHQAFKHPPFYRF